MKYTLSNCPVCAHLLNTSRNLYICTQGCKFTETEMVKILTSLPLNLAKRIVDTNDCGEVEDDGDLNKTVYALSYGEVEFKINAWVDGKPWYKFPTVYPRFPDLGKIIILDDPSLLLQLPKSQNLIAMPTVFQESWQKYVSGKDIVLLFTSREMDVRISGNIISEYASSVKIGKFTGNLEDDIQRATFVRKNDRKTENQPKEKYDTLKELIQSFHWQNTARHGIIYRPGVSVPIEEVVNSVILWLQNHGAVFMWDDMQGMGYMLWEKEIYRLDRNDPDFKSLMFDLGGVTYSTNEGRNILEGMQALKHRSIVLEPTPWLSNTEEKVVLNQGGEDIIISAEGVTTNATDTFTYGMLESSSFKPMQIEPVEDMEKSLSKLFTLCVDFFAIPEVAKEIIICWMLGIFLQDLSSIRPGLRIKGYAGTGKSTILKLIYWLFYGDSNSKLPRYTIAALWRRATIDPLIIIDNENVEKSMDENLRTFFDLAATGGSRFLGSNNSGYDTKQQKAHCLVLMSGLDTFVHADVLTRYIEVETDFAYQKDYYELEEKHNLLKSRNEIFSAVFQMLSKDVFPNIFNYLNRHNNNRVKVLLDTKERIVDYFLIMLAIGEALQKYNVIPPGNLETRWTEYIRNKSQQTALKNALTIEWWKNFKYAITINEQQAIQMTSEGLEILDKFNFIVQKGKKMGIKGTQEELLNALSWSARLLNRILPWKKANDLMVTTKDDLPAWKSIGWKMETLEEDVYEIYWGGGI
jgi:hypothetical protein